VITCLITWFSTQIKLSFRFLQFNLTKQFNYSNAA
jgi:hypothetical protein